MVFGPFIGWILKLGIVSANGLTFMGFHIVIFEERLNSCSGRNLQVLGALLGVLFAIAIAE